MIMQRGCFVSPCITPEILVREDFEREVLWYKARLVFSGAVMDYRGFYGAIVG
jgi:hypothetical protein